MPKIFLSFVLSACLYLPGIWACAETKAQSSDTLIEDEFINKNFWTKSFQTIFNAELAGASVLSEQQHQHHLAKIKHLQESCPPFDLTGKHAKRFNLEKDELECLPEVLYSWMNAERMSYFQQKLASKAWAKTELGTTVFTTRTPLSSYGYGLYQMRLKLNKNTPFTYFDDHYASDEKFGNTFDICKNDKFKRWPGVIVRVPKHFQPEFILCNFSSVHSVSFGLEAGKKEMQNELSWVIRHRKSFYSYYDLSIGFPQYKEYVRAGNGSLFLVTEIKQYWFTGNISFSEIPLQPDYKIFSVEELKKRFADFVERHNQMGPQFYKNPSMKKSTKPALEEHFQQEFDNYFHPSVE